MSDDPTEVQRLADFFDGKAKALCDSAIRPSGFNSARSQLDQGEFLQAFYHVPLDCTQAPFDEERAWARAVMENGTENETFAQLYAISEAALANFTRELNLTRPGSQLDLQVWALLADHVLRGHGSLQSASLAFQSYWAEVRDDFQLGYVLGSLAIGPRVDEFRIGMIRHFPWQHNSVCEVPDLDNLAKSAQAKLNKGISIAQNLTDSGARERFGATMRQGELSFFVEQRWWPALLALDAELAFVLAKWENYTTDPMPTIDEARYLMASYRNQTSSLWIDYMLYYEQIRLDQPEFHVAWVGDYETGGNVALALPALKSPFESINCSMRVT